MVKRGKLQDNPWKGQSFARDKAEDGTTDIPKERPFTDAEIKALLATDAEPRLRDSMLILALSGMRREELCMLRVRDCDADAFHIRAAKTRAGIRRVPIHPDLLQLVAKRTAGKPLDAFLIHELGPEPAKGSLRGRGAPLTQQFERFRQSVGVHDKPEGNRRSLVNLHSFRRFFITKAERAGQPPWIIESVVGHKRTGMTLGVYSAGSSAEQLRACVEAVRLP